MNFNSWKLFVFVIIEVEQRLLESSNAVVVVLEGGLDPYQGHVVLLTDSNDASSICFHTGSGLENFARVVCRQFGAFGGHASPSLLGTRAVLAPSLAISQNGCKGTEPSIFDCDHSEISSCTEGLDYMVHCSKDPDVHRGIRLLEGGIVDLYYDGKWNRMKEKGSNAEETWNQLPMLVACRQLGMSGGSVVVSEKSDQPGQPGAADGYMAVNCDSQNYTSLYQCTIRKDDSPAPPVRLQCNQSLPDVVVEGVLPVFHHASQGHRSNYLLCLSSMDALVFEARSCSGLKLRLFPTGSSEDSMTEVIVDKLVPFKVKSQIIIRECQDTYHCRTSIISRAPIDRLFQCNGSNYPTDYASWIRINLNIKQLVDSGVLAITGWRQLATDDPSSWIESDLADRKTFNVTLSSPLRLLEYLEVASTEHQVAFRVPRDINVNKCLVTKAELEQGVLQRCGDDYVDQELCTIQCGCCFNPRGLRFDGPQCFHPIASESPAIPKACNRPFATLHGLVVILNNCPCHANTNATFIVLIQNFNPRLVAILNPGNGEENQTISVESTPNHLLPEWAERKLDSVLITGVTAFARGTITYRYSVEGNYSATVFLLSSRPETDVSTFQVAVKITKRQSLRDVVQMVTFLNNGPVRRNRKVSFLIALSAVSAQMQVALQHREFVTSMVTLDEKTVVPEWARGKVDNSDSLKYRALVESSYSNPGMYKPALILSDWNFEDVVYRVGSVKVLSSEELAGGVYLLAEGGNVRPSNTMTFALLVEKTTNSTSATISFGDGSMSSPHLNRFSKDLPQWVANEMTARWKNPYAIYGSLTTHMFWSPGEYHVLADVSYDQNSIDDPIRAKVTVSIMCAVELALTGGGRDLANVVTYNRGDSFVIAATVSLTCARDGVRFVRWNVYFLQQTSGSPFPVTDERPDFSNRLKEDEVRRMFVAWDILFRVPSFTLRYGIYVFEVNVSSTSGAHQTASTWVFIRPVNIGVQLSGQVYLQAGLNELVQFQVISQTDPDEGPQSQSSPFAYRWHCVLGVGMLTPELLKSETGGCFGRGANLSTESLFLVFNTSQLEYRTLPQLYTFWVVAFKGARSGYDHRFLELLADTKTPQASQSPELFSDFIDSVLVDIVCISNCLASLNPDAKLTLTAICRTCPPNEELVYKWELAPRDSNSTIAGFNLSEHGIVDDRSTLTIVPFLLSLFDQVTKMELYELKATVTRPNRQNQSAIYVFAVGIVHDSEESALTRESRNSASLKFHVSGHKYFLFQVLALSTLLFLIVFSQSLPWGLVYWNTNIRICMIFLLLVLPCLSVAWSLLLPVSTSTRHLSKCFQYFCLFTPGFASELCLIAWVLFIA